MLPYRCRVFCKLVLLRHLPGCFFFGGLHPEDRFTNFNRPALLFPACGCLCAEKAYDDWRRWQIKNLPLGRWGDFSPAEDPRL